MSLNAPIFLQLILAQGIGAITFHPNCSLPTAETKFHILAGPNVRSTWTILWSCLFTIFLCTWTVQHPTVPDIEDKKSSWWRRLWRKHSERVVLMGVGLLAPEMILGYALNGNFTARSWGSCDVLRDYASRTKGTEWTQTHAYFADMCGFLLQKPEQPDLESSNSRSTELAMPQDSRRDDATSTVSERIKPPERLHGPYGPDADFPNAQKCDTKHDEWIYDSFHDISPDRNLASEPLIDPRPPYLHFPVTLDCLQLCFLLKRDLIAQFPLISEAEIEDKSKEDLLVKLLSLWQILWLCIQLIFRKAYGLASTQLEIATLSFAICTSITYLFWLKKPKNVGLPVTLRLSRSLTSEETRILLRLQDFEESDKDLALHSVHRDKLYLRVFSAKIDTFGGSFLLGGMVFGACHCFAWNFDFPTQVEQTLWRIASIAQVLALSPYVLLDTITSEGAAYSAKATAETLLVVIYVIARLYIMVEVFRSLFYSPPDAFVATWALSVPHIG